MSPLDAARELSTSLIGTQCDFCTGSEISGHFDGCPMLIMPSIVAALEAAEAVVFRAYHPDTDRPNRRGYTAELRALAAALKGEVVPTT